jgi:hypothetical protein
MTYQVTGKFSANVPFIVNTYDGESYSSLTAYNVSVVTTTGKLTSSAVSSFTPCATFQYISGDYDNYNFYGLANGAMRRASGTASFKPFSGYFRAPLETANEVKIRFVYEEDEIFDPTGIESTADDKLVVYTSESNISIDAQNATPVKVCSISGAVIFNGVVEGAKSFELPAGVYIVNGKKYFVK